LQLLLLLLVLLQDLSTSKTGKHGHAKIKMAAKDVGTGKNVEGFETSHTMVEVPGKRWLDEHKARFK
jgi:translation elongation factor P/translation initiation factor 5A